MTSFLLYLESLDSGDDSPTVSIFSFIYFILLDLCVIFVRVYCLQYFIHLTLKYDIRFTSVSLNRYSLKGHLKGTDSCQRMICRY